MMEKTYTKKEFKLDELFQKNNAIFDSIDPSGATFLIEICH